MHDIIVKIQINWINTVFFFIFFYDMYISQAENLKLFIKIGSIDPQTSTPSSTKTGLYIKQRPIRHTMAYSDHYRLSRQFHTVKTVADCQDNCRKFQTISDMHFLVCSFEYGVSAALMGGSIKMACLPAHCFNLLWC